MDLTKYPASSVNYGLRFLKYPALLVNISYNTESPTHNCCDLGYGPSEVEI